VTLFWDMLTFISWLGICQ